MRQTFKLNGHDVTRALIAAQNLADSEPPPPAVAGMGLAMLIRKLVPIVQDLEMTRNKALARAKTPEQQPAAQEEVERLYESSHEITATPVRWDQFGEKGPNGKHFAHLGPLGVIGDEAEDAPAIAAVA